MTASIATLVQAFDAGQTKYSYWRKVPAQTTASGIWFDLSMSTGNPLPNYYIGPIGVSTALARSTDGGIDHGPNVSPLRKVVNRFLVMNQTATAVPLPWVMCDYLMFYPFISQDAGDFALTNSITLPRYPTGAGVQIMPVVTNAQAGGAQFFVTYTNQAGVSGRTSKTVTCNTQGAPGTILTTAPATAGASGPFIPLQAGDSGVRSIENVTFLSSDVGLFALVLVRPLLTGHLFDITGPTEIVTVVDRAHPPIPIVDDAFLGLICCPSGTLSGAPFNGEIETVWS